MAMVIKFTYQEPIFGKDIAFGLIPASELEISPYQRELSQQHIRNLQKSISSLGFIDPLIVYPEGDKYYVVNGQHRLMALRELLTNPDSPIPVVIISKDDAMAVLKLNIEKALSLKDKSIQALKVYRDIMEKKPNLLEEELIDIIEEPIYITFGLLYEKLARFSGSAFYNIFKKVDKFMNTSLTEAYQKRQKYADMLLNLYEKFVEARQRLIDSGMNSLEATQYLASQINPFKRQRNVDCSFEEAVKLVEERLNQLLSSNSGNLGADAFTIDEDLL